MKADPMFAAIERNRAEWKKAAVAGYTRAADNDGLLKTVPTTIAGMVALLQYAASGEPGLEHQPAEILNAIAKWHGLNTNFSS